MDGQEISPAEPWLERVRARIVPLCDLCVAATRVDGGGVALLSSAGLRAVVHTTDRAATALETLQIDLAEGPCVDAGVGRSPVLIGDLGDSAEGIAERWPFFLPQADALGIRAVFAFPLRVGGVVLGTLELYRVAAGRLEPPELSTALKAAASMGAAIVDVGGSLDGAPGDGAAGDGATGETTIGRSAAAVHQAAGMVMVQLDVSVDEAMSRLRASAFAEGISLIHLATDVIRGRRRFTKEQT